MSVQHIRQIREVVVECAAEAGVEVDDESLTVVLVILHYMHLLNDPWDRGFRGTPVAWIMRVKRAAREALVAVVSREVP